MTNSAHHFALGWERRVRDMKKPPVSDEDAGGFEPRTRIRDRMLTASAECAEQSSSVSRVFYEYETEGPLTHPRHDDRHAVMRRALCAFTCARCGAARCRIWAALRPTGAGIAPPAGVVPASS